MYRLTFICLILASMTQFAYGQIQLVKNGESLYKIVIGDGSKNEKAAEVVSKRGVVIPE